MPAIANISQPVGVAMVGDVFIKPALSTELIIREIGCSTYTPCNAPS